MSIVGAEQIKRTKDWRKSIEIASDLVERCIGCGERMNFQIAGAGNAVCDNTDCRRYMIPRSPDSYYA